MKFYEVVSVSSGLIRGRFSYFCDGPLAHRKALSCPSVTLHNKLLYCLSLCAILSTRKVRAHKGGLPSHFSEGLTLQTKERRACQCMLHIRI
nr:MAG TPA: hypothetical protein [Caudoviricetes sp.]